MLNIPEKVKTLFREDSIRKKLRIHFPNGEREDITNPNILSESFSFTESLCSQSTLKFGLCEASEIQFTTVGIGNIKGCEIEASIALDMPARYGNLINGSDKTVIIDSSELMGTGYYMNAPVYAGEKIKLSFDYSVEAPEGVQKTLELYGEKPIVTISFSKTNGSYSIDRLNALHDFANKGTEIKASVYNELYPVTISNFAIELEEPLTEEDLIIPIGKFTVDTCQKQPDMRFRKVVAYDKAAEFDKLSVIEDRKKYFMERKSAIHSFDVYKFLISNYNIHDSLQIGEEIEWEGYSTTLQNGMGVVIGVTLNCKQKIFRSKDELSKLYYLENDYVSSGAVSGFKDALNHFIDTYEKIYALNYTTNRENYVNSLTRDACPTVYLPNIGYIHITDDSKYIYPYVNYAFDFDCDENMEWIYLPSIYIPVSANFSIITSNDDGSHQTAVYETYVIKEEIPKLYEVDTSDKFSIEYLPREIGQDIDAKSILEGYTELIGEFGKSGRNGEFGFLKIYPDFGLYPSDDLYPDDDLYPAGAAADIIEKSDCKIGSPWYDDSYTKPYDRVSVTYTDTDGNSKYAYKNIADTEADDYNPGDYQTYSLSDNYLIKNCTFTAEQITQILATVAENIEYVQYLPADIDSRGLPWIEAGDVVSVVTDDGGFETIVLQRTLSGIQALTDNFESRG